MAFVDQAALAVNTTFRDKVKVAAIIAAEQIQGEAQGALSATKYQKRQKLAQRVIQGGPSATVEMFAWAVAASSSITTSSTDADIQFTVNSVWDDVAAIDVTD